MSQKKLNPGTTGVVLIKTDLKLDTNNLKLFYGQYKQYLLNRVYRGRRMLNNFYYQYE